MTAPTNTPRQYTSEEVRQQFLDALASSVLTWRDSDRATTAEAKLTGLVHSMLVMLDGWGALPKFVVAPDPDPDDEQDRRAHWENWYPAGAEHDIAGELQDLWPEALRRAGLDVP